MKFTYNAVSEFVKSYWEKNVERRPPEENSTHPVIHSLFPLPFFLPPLALFSSFYLFLAYVATLPTSFFALRATDTTKV